MFPKGPKNWTVKQGYGFRGGGGSGMLSWTRYPKINNYEY